MKFEGIEIALEGIWYEDKIPSSAISIPSIFIFFKSLCGGERIFDENTSDFQSSWLL